MKKPEKPYTPMGVLNMMKAKGVRVPVGTDFGKPTKAVLDAAGDVVKIPEPCAILLLAFTKGSKMVPDDFHNVGKSGAALKTYVRPDGGVYLGAFQVQGEVDGIVVVYGDPAMSTGAAQKIALRYRQRLMEQYEGEKAMEHLGPFAAGAVSEPSPAVSEQDRNALT